MMMSTMMMVVVMMMLMLVMMMMTMPMMMVIIYKDLKPGHSVFRKKFVTFPSMQKILTPYVFTVNESTAY